MTMAGDEPDTRTTATGHDAETIMLDFVNPAGPTRRQASRFSQVYEQYKKAPDVTRQRIYLETMERVLGGTDKTIIDTGGQSSPGVVPYLPLTSLPRERPTQQQQPAGGN